MKKCYILKKDRVGEKKDNLFIYYLYIYIYLFNEFYFILFLIFYFLSNPI